MDTLMPGDWLDGTFRLHAAYQVIARERLPPARQQELASFAEDPDFFGLLQHQDGQRVHPIGRDTALFLFAMREAGPLPAFARRRAEADGLRHLMAWIADGILEVEVEGRFVSGSAAAQAIGLPASECGTGAPEPDGGGAVARLSRAAVQYAARLPLMDVSILAARLYLYHRVPLGPAWQRRCPDAAALDRWLGLAPGQEAERALRGFTRRNTAEGTEEGWWTRSRGERSPASLSRRNYKLYVSPDCAALPDAIAALARVLPDGPCTSFKYPNSLQGWLRPDKIVLYFQDFEALSETAERLDQALAGIPAHGVPFTASRNPDGLMSWGVDPDPGTASHELGVSWRMYVARSLASALRTARAQGDDAEPWEFALQRARLDGIDPERWTPDPSLFRAEV